MAKFILPPHLQARIISDTRPATRAPPTGPLPDPAAPKPAKPRKKTSTGTNSFTQAVVQLLTLEGCLIWRHNNAPVYDPKLECFRRGSAKTGLPDTLGFYRTTGHIVAVEIKTGKDVLSDEQREFLAAVRAAGGFACEGRSLEQVRKEFHEWKQSLTQFTKAA
ncbi:VRR-NUC domain-containing protein [Hymenobacter sediminicola]|uniref:VRR-NUC domain-containing protein n=1 Tax=Hymenobacter sediminicola TaxID=2761579 RepID=A0A7G7W2Y7_9BACT|nr:VRR-NUC domain-containing protein [Hymenobacter sediminicola]QNH60730.1 VRR-NUC domain-containing protein [Hymenobacter sediminicola]